MTSWLEPQPGGLLYSFTKAGLIMMTRSWAREFGPHGVRVNAIAPGLVQTDFSAFFWKDETYRAHVESTQPIRRVAVELAVNPGTVSRAYAELEHEGFLTSQDGSGTFVASPPPGEPRQAELESLCLAFLQEVAGRGFAIAEALRTLATFRQRRLLP